jgi:hypothetical protein
MSLVRAASAGPQRLIAGGTSESEIAVVRGYSVIAMIRREPEGELDADSVAGVHVKSIRPAQAGRYSSDGHDAGDFDDLADEILELDGVTGLEVGRHGFAANPRDAHLAFRFGRVREVDVHRHLAVNADRLQFLEDSVFRPF